MASMASDVIGGFNSFLAAQQADGDDAVLTLVQFDSHDPHEVLWDAVDIAKAKPLTSGDFVPRGGTPLYDAMGHLVADATIRAEARERAGKHQEAIVCVTFTDGLENQSTEYGRDAIFDLVKNREAKGWTFAYLGANQDSYAEGGGIGFNQASIQNFAGDAAGSAAAFRSLTSSVSRRRGKMRSGVAYASSDLFEGDKGAEDDLRSRSAREQPE